MKKIPNSKLVIMLGFWKYKIIFAKGYTSNWSEEVFVVSKIKNTVSWTWLVTLMVKKLLKVFMKKNFKKLVRKNAE